MIEKYKKGNYTAFTVKGEGGVLKEIMFPIAVRIPEAYVGFSHELVTVNAIWDTGATNSVISSSLAQQMNIPPTGRATCRGVHGTKDVNTYIIDIILQGRVQYSNVRISEGDILGESCQFLIGMDIIATGDSSIGLFKDENGKACTIFTFRCPSLFEPVDYVEEINRVNREIEFQAKNKELRKQYNRNRRKKKK